MADPVVSPEQSPDNMNDLLTAAKTNLVAAINEVVGSVAKTEKVVHVAIGVSGPVAIPALPVGSIITNIQTHVSTLYPSGATITIGDHSGTSGALAATAILTAAGTATATGEYSNPVYKTPVGDLSVSRAGGDGSTGAAVVLIRYIDA